LLVTCHGAPPCIKPSVEITLDEWRRVHQTDLYGTFLVCQEVGKVMLSQGMGCMVLLSSLHARQSYPQRAVYAAAKAGVVGLMRALAIEWGPSHLRVNAISPWQVAGPRTQAMIDQEREDTGGNLLALYEKRAPLKRIVSGEDLAETVVYLSNNRSITGQNIVVDCGISSSIWYKEYE